MRVLVDACVIVDVLQAREPFRAEAEKIFIAAANKRVDAFITAKSVTDIYYLIHRSTHSDKETRKILSNLFVIFEVIDSAGLDCLKALSSEMTDYEDAVMTETALRTGMDWIVTRNVKDYGKSPVSVCTPSEFLSLIEQKNDV